MEKQVSERRPRLCMVLRSFAPRNESGSLRCTAFARYLPEFGVDVSVFCAAPEDDNRLAGTAAHVADDWEDDPNWQRVTRVKWPWVSSSRALLRRMPLGASAVRREERRKRLAALYPQLRDHVRACEPDLLFASCAPSDTLALARRASREFGIPYITDLRDPWATVSAAPHRHLFDYWLERAFESRLHAEAAHVTVAAGRSADLLVQEHGIPREKITFIPNGFVDEDFADHQVPHDIPADKFVIVHSGELGAGNRKVKARAVKGLLGLDYDPLSAEHQSRSAGPLMEALKQLFDRSPSMRRKVAMAFTGLKPDRLPAAIEAFPYQDNLFVFGRIPTNEAHGLMLRADLLVLMATNYFRRGREFCCTIPAKTYSYLRTGNPILAATISSEIRELLQPYPNVDFAHPAKPGEIATLIERRVTSYEGGRTKSFLPPCPSGVSRYGRREGTRLLSELVHAIVGQAS